MVYVVQDKNRAGINISDQLDDIDEYVMMNMESTEYVATTTYDTQNNFISETYNVNNIKINLLLMGANSWKPI